MPIGLASGFKFNSVDIVILIAHMLQVKENCQRKMFTNSEPPAWVTRIGGSVMPVIVSTCWHRFLSSDLRLY